LQPADDDSNSGLEKLKFIIENKIIYQTWILLIYVVFGIVLIPFLIDIFTGNLNTFKEFLNLKV